MRAVLADVRTLGREPHVDVRIVAAERRPRADDDEGAVLCASVLEMVAVAVVLREGGAVAGAKLVLALVVTSTAYPAASRGTRPPRYAVPLRRPGSGLEHDLAYS